MLDSLRYTSALSVGLAVVFVIITAGIAMIKLINGSIEMPRLMPKVYDQASFWKLFTTIPILVTAYICHHNIHPIENELKDPAQMKSIVRASLALCSSVYVATIRVSYGIHLMLVFPIVFFSLRLNVDGLLFPYAIPIAFDNRRFFTVTAALMGFIFMVANFVPSIWDAFQFTGATATISVGYIFPAAIALRDVHGIATKHDRLVSWVMILLAISSSTVAISSDVYTLFCNDKGVGS
ncbi:Amino acid transporter, transmembrane domain containing protein [Parasponia andersonii]|uniref:Amino acid transporter, transmembrane domain containing protein n=1 Tax=Parasponia andersonii TaxID=3476 RepID=A0A2P5CWZ2_PARAD|nr:Amino acid transporter, transmembrane domain containing protein [Parasponia andersonii]